MNNKFYNEFHNHYKDFRKREALKWFNDNYFVALYTKDDEYITFFDDIETTSNSLNLDVKTVLKRIRKNEYIVFKNHFCKLYLVRKEKELSISR